MKSHFKISMFFRLIVVLAAVLIALYFAAVVVIGTQWFHDMLVRRVTQKLEAETGATVEMRSLEIKPMIFQVTLRGLTLHGSEPSTEAPLFTSKAIVIRVNPLSVIRGKLLISNFDGEGIEVHVITRPDGSLNIPGWHPARGGVFRSKVNVSIQSLLLNDASFYWNDQMIPLDLSARRVAFLLNRNPGGAYTGSFSTTSLNMKARGLRPPELVVATHIRYSHHAIALNHLVWRSAVGSGSGDIHLQWNSRMQGLASLKGRGNLRPLARWFGWKPIRSGEYQVVCNASYLNGSLSATGHVRADRILLRSSSLSPGPVNLSSDISANASHIKLTNMAIHALGGSFYGVGSVLFKNKEPEFTINGQVGRVVLAKVLRAVPKGSRLEGLFPVVSTISGKVEASWRGSLEGLVAAFDLKATSEPALGNTRSVAGIARGSVRFDHGMLLELDQAELKTPRSSFRAQGTLGEAGSQLSLAYSTTDFQEAAGLLDAITGLSKPVPLTLRSSATFVGALSGALADPRIQGQISVGAFSYKGWDWQSLKGSIAASPNGIAINAGRLRAGQSIFDFDGSASLTTWKITSSSELRLSARAKNSPLRGLEDAFGFHFPLRGVASGDLKLAGAPSNLAGSGDFLVFNGSLAGEPFRKLSGKVLVRDSSFDFRNVSLEEGAGALTGEASVNWPSRSFSMEFRGVNLSLGDFERLQRRMPKSEGERTMKPLQGILSFHAEGSGRLNDPNVHSTVNIRSLEVDGKTAGNLQAELVLAGKRLTAAANLQGADGKSDLSAVIGTRGNWPIQLKGTFSDFRLDPWISLAGGSLATPVVASGSVEAAGPLKEPGKITGRANVAGLSVRIPGFSVTNVHPITIRYAGGFIDSSHFEMQGPSTQLQIHLSGHVGPPVEISLDALGSAQASLLSFFDPSVEAVGSIGLNLHARGSPALPSLSGEVQVRNLSLRYRGLPLPLSNLNGTILLKGNRATLNSFGEESGQTSIHMSGYATIGPNPGFNLQASFEHVRLEYPAGFTSLLTGQVKLSGSEQNPELNGEAYVNQMFASENFNVVDWIGQMGQSFETPAPSAPHGFASKVKLNIRVLTNPIVRLDSRTLSYAGTIDLTLRGTLARPAMTGDIHLRQGQALVAGVRYQINRGDISLTSPVQIAPVVDIEAETRVERYNLTIEITGPADRARISYRSDPPLPTEQIISLLALGYAPQQALITSTGSGRLGAIGAGSLLTQALSNQVSGRFQKLFGASRIRIDPNLLGPSTAGGARVTVEEQVSKDLTITYSTNTAAAQQRDIRMRWDLSNKISLIGERDINGVYGFEVRFRRSVK